MRERENARKRERERERMRERAGVGRENQPNSGLGRSGGPLSKNQGNEKRDKYLDVVSERMHMALFYADIRRDSASLLRFPFFSNVQIFSWEILLVYPLKYPYNYFSLHFCFLVIVVLLIFVLFVLFLIAVINLSLYIFMLSSSHLIDLFSMVASRLPVIY